VIPYTSVRLSIKYEDAARTINGVRMATVLNWTSELQRNATSCAVTPAVYKAPLSTIANTMGQVFIAPV
jgi:hypothetical protein